MFNSALLRIARESLGLTQTKLAERSGFRQAEISRWEKALRDPTPAQIARLADAVEVPVALLTSEKRIGQPVHRSRKRERMRVTKLADARLEMARLALDELVRSVDLGDPPLVFPDQDDALEGSDPEVAASIVRRVWGVGTGPLPSVGELIEAAGGIVAHVDFGTADIDAAYSRIRSGQRWFWSNPREVDPARLRFSLAHELGHAMLHWERFSGPVAADAEKEAHWFASALLMPRDEIRRALLNVRSTLTEFIHVARFWQVSVQALMMRARQVEAITADEHTKLWRHLNARGWGKAALVEVRPDGPGLVDQILTVHRTDHHYTDTEIAAICGLPLARLQTLMPGYFPRSPEGHPGLRLVGSREASA